MCGLKVSRSAIAPGGFYGGRSITIEFGCFLNERVFIDALADVYIGKDARVGMDTMLLTSSHEIGPQSLRAGRLRPGPIVIGEGCWIGARVTVMPGVTIGPGTVVGSGSLVTSDLDANSLYFGSPARLVRRLTPR
jgi:maltose O-acetyltransferase